MIIIVVAVAVFETFLQIKLAMIINDLVFFILFLDVFRAVRKVSFKATFVLFMLMMFLRGLWSWSVYSLGLILSSVSLDLIDFPYTDEFTAHCYVVVV